MGREATCTGRVGSASGEVKALLEPGEFILRGAIRRRWPRAALRGACVRGPVLCFEVDGEAVELDLGEAEAPRWLAQLDKAPPSLAAKLGIGPAQRAFVHGQVDDAELAQALSDATTTDAAAAALSIAVVRNHAALAAAIEAHAALPCRLLWVVNPKGKGAVPSDAEVRAAMHARGWRDSKTCAVSATLTATRYGKPAG